MIQTADLDIHYKCRVYSTHVISGVGNGEGTSVGRPARDAQRADGRRVGHHEGRVAERALRGGDRAGGAGVVARLGLQHRQDDHGPDGRQGLLATTAVRNLTLFSAEISRVEAQRSELRRVIGRAFDGALTPLIQFLVEDEDLTRDEIAELRKLIKRRAQS